MVLDSTEPKVLEAGLELLGGRPVINSVNYEDGDGPESRIARIMPMIREHGAAVIALTIDEEGQARTAEWKVRVASRLIDDLTGTWGMRVEDILIDCLTFPIATGQEETRRDALETIEAIREVKRRYPGGTDDARPVQRVLRSQPGRRARSSTRCSCTSALKPASTPAIVHSEQDPAAVPDPRGASTGRARHGLRPAAEGYDPLQRFLELFEGVDGGARSREAELLALPLFERLERRIVDGARNGLDADLEEALGSGVSASTSSTTRC